MKMKETVRLRLRAKCLNPTNPTAAKGDRINGAFISGLWTETGISSFSFSEVTPRIAPCGAPPFLISLHLLFHQGIPRIR